MPEQKSVVVGVDGSAESRAAVAFALRNGVARGDRVLAVTAVTPPDLWVAAYGMVNVPPVEDDLPRAQQAAQAMVDEVAAEEGAQQVDVACEARVGIASQVLLDAAAEADELVVGHRGRGGFASAVLGSVGLSCVLHAPGPVTIVRAANRDAASSTA